MSKPRKRSRQKHYYDPGTQPRARNYGKLGGDPIRTRSPRSDAEVEALERAKEKRARKAAQRMRAARRADVDC